MAHIQYLCLEQVNLPFPDSYGLSFSSVEADTTGETEAGTTQRDVIRSGVATIEVSFTVSAAWASKLTYFSKLDKLSAAYFDTEDLCLKNAEMYIKDFKSKLLKDTTRKGLWSVSFTLQEF